MQDFLIKGLKSGRVLCLCACCEYVCRDLSCVRYFTGKSVDLYYQIFEGTL